MPNRLRNSIYWNAQRMSELLAQAAPAKSKLVLAALDLKASPTSLGVGATLERQASSTPAWSVVLDVVVDALRESGQLLAIRPETAQQYRESDCEYVQERVLATKLVLPVDDELVLQGIPKLLTVWVADPPGRRLEPRDEWDLFGSYLFLLEEGDPKPRPGLRGFLRSGTSALAYLVEHTRSTPLSNALASEFGRGSTAHPITKLEQLGAQASLPREIETLYQIRAMSDEQSGWSVSEGRTNDLLAYPLAIFV
jgi:hypothetical protein